MQRTQANRAIIASRITEPARRNTGGVGINVAARVQTYVAPLRGASRSTKRSKARGVLQRDSRGLRSDWTRSPYAPYGGWR